MFDRAISKRASSPGADSTVRTVPPIVRDTLRTNGRPLDSATRNFMEPRFGHDLNQVGPGAAKIPMQSDMTLGSPDSSFERNADRVATAVIGAKPPRMGPRYDFSGVRVHTGDCATASANAIGARAYTIGRNIVFGAGEYAPATYGGRELLAHELAHVVQQSPNGEAAPALLVQRKGKESARFEGDAILDQIAAGTTKSKLGDTGGAVTKLQEALAELHYLPFGAVTGTFASDTGTALLKFQHDKKISGSGEFDAATLAALTTAFKTRQSYVDNAVVDPLKPETHALNAADKASAVAAMVPGSTKGKSLTFVEDLGPPQGKYGDRIAAALKSMIANFHKELFTDMKPLRANPAKNFDSWSVIEAPAAAAKDVVDQLYGSNYGGAGFKKPMTHKGGNLIDQWTDEVAANAGLTAANKKSKARGKVEYLIDSNCASISEQHSAVPSRAAEAAILKPIIDDLVATGNKVQILLDLDIGWEGAQLDGKVYLQRFKSQLADPVDAKEANRVKMWDLFQTCIHEYLHTLASPRFNTWAGTFLKAKDNTRYNSLTEGFCDFFTLNVRKTVVPTTVQGQVEGPYANGNPPAAENSGVYPSHAQAEQVIATVGIKNAQAAYFGGKVELMGGP